MDLKIAGFPPIKDLSEKVSKLTEGEEQSIAEESGQGGQIWNGNHFDQSLHSKLQICNPEIIHERNWRIFMREGREKGEKEATICGPPVRKIKKPTV